MAITYNWVISSMNEYPKTEDNLTDVVFNVHYRRNATEVDQDKTWFSETYNVASIPAPTPENFIPYEDLTFEQVCGWLEQVLNVEAIDESLARQIELQKNPPVVSLPLPWLNNPTGSESE
jgi:hypothetical protein